jgi:hypothetical protein
VADLDFKPLSGHWHNGNDFGKVEVTKITGPPGVSALLYTCHVNIDYDGAADAYGPPGKVTLDSLQNAGYPRWYYGLLAIHPQARAGDFNDNSFESFTIGTKGALVKDAYHLELDTRYPDSKGRCPVVQKTGAHKGYYISATPHHHGPMFEQSSYIDASSVAFAALSGNLNTIGGVQLKDFGLAIRHNQPLQSAFYFADAGGTKGYTAQALGECSYKLFLDLGGPRKQPGHTPNNNFFVSYLVFPRSNTGDTSETAISNGISFQLERICTADNSYELPLLMGFAGMAGKGKSGMDGLKAWRKMSKEEKFRGIPTNYTNIALGLTVYGFRGDPISQVIGGLADLAAKFS